MLPNSNVRRKTPLEINFNIHAISKFTAFKNMLHNQLCSFHNMPFISKFYYFLKKYSLFHKPCTKIKYPYRSDKMYAINKTL